MPTGKLSTSDLPSLVLRTIWESPVRRSKFSPHPQSLILFFAAGLNIGCYNEAAEHLLAAIHGQVTNSNRPDKSLPEGDEDGSGNLWQTFRRAFLCLVRPLPLPLMSCALADWLGTQDRHDLAERAHVGADVESFRNEFEF